MMAARRQAILVAGMHRSGTSATAGALALAGVSLGNRLLEAGVDNPKGYWEHECAVAINDALLSRLDRAWDDVRSLPAGWTDGDPAHDAIAAIVALLRDEFGDTALFAVKDPRICRVMHVWLEALNTCGIDPLVLFVVRPPREVAASLQARNGWATDVGLLLWLRYTIEAERASRGFRRAVVTYDGMLNDPTCALDAVAARLGISLPDLDVTRLSGFIEASQRHHHLDRSDDDNPIAMLANELHASLEGLANADGDWTIFNTAAETFDELYLEHAGLIDGLAEMLGKARSQIALAKVEQAQCATELRSQLDWSRKAVEKEEALLAQAARLASELNAQLAWSRNSVKLQNDLYAQIATLKSDLVAQVAWSEEAMKVREKLQADLAQVKSKLFAQVAWSEEAMKAREQLQSQIVQLKSDLAELTQALQTETEAHARARTRIEECEALSERMRASWSWRVTRPARALHKVILKNNDAG